MVDINKEDTRAFQEETRWFMGVYYIAWIANVRPVPPALAGMTPAEIEAIQNRIGYALPFLLYHRPFSPATQAGRNAIFALTGLDVPVWGAFRAALDVFPVAAAEENVATYDPGRVHDNTMMTNADLRTDIDVLVAKPRFMRLVLGPFDFMIDAFTKDYGNQFLQMLPVMNRLFDFR